MGIPRSADVLRGKRNGPFPHPPPTMYRLGLLATTCRAFARSFRGRRRLMMSRFGMAFWLLVLAMSGLLPSTLPVAVAGEARSGKESSPDRSAGSRRQLPGTLIIVGGGSTPRAALARALDLAGGPAARVLVIPFAWGREATGRPSARMWQQAGADKVTILTWADD